MSAKHTPGPWKAHFGEAYYATGPDLGRVAMMMNLKGAHGLGGRRSGEESAANCRLISSAPDLLEALERLLPYARYAFMQSDEEEHLLEAAIERSTYAIAKAKGQ